MQTILQQKYRHVKTNGVYVVMAIGRLESDLTEVVVYQSVENGSVWVRNKSEFEDGRFVRIS